MGMKTGNFLKQLREDAGLSQARLAHSLGLKSAQSISNIERGIAPLPQAKIAAVAKALKANPEKIVDVVVDEIRDRYITKLKKGAAKRRGRA